MRAGLRNNEFCLRGLMATHVLRDITDSIRLSPFIAVMMDDTTDVSNREQATIVFCTLNNFEVNEEFIGLYEVPSFDSKTLVVVLKDSLCRMNIDPRAML